MSEVEIIKEDKIETESVFLRTVIKKSVYERLREFAQRYSTGRGNWDFGVAIEMLLDHKEESELSKINDKLELLINGLEHTEEPQEEEQYEEFLGGHKEKIDKGEKQ
jgi:hypothetical protein